MDKPINDEDLVFCHTDGSPLLPHSVSQEWRRFVRKAGFPGIRMHDARHTHDSLMLARGGHPKVILERLGHNSVSLTLDVYSHVLPGIQEAAALAFDNAFKGETQEAKQKLSEALAGN